MHTHTHLYTHIYTYTHMCTTCSECVTDVCVGVKTHLCNVHKAQDAECGCHEQQEVNEKQPKPRNSPSHNHDSTAPRQHPLIYTGAGLIHPVHGPLLSPATEAIAPKGFTFLPFWRGFGVFFYTLSSESMYYFQYLTSCILSPMV